MFEKLFKSERAQALEDRARAVESAAAVDSKFKAEIAILESDLDFQILRRARKKEQEIAEIHRQWNLAREEQRRILAEIDGRVIDTTPPVVAEMRRFLWEERRRSSAERVNRGIVRRNIFGAAKGVLQTNAPAIDGRIAAIDLALKQLEDLKHAPAETDFAARVQEIRAAVPDLDVSIREVDCAPGIAALLA